jgi:hypothetical protein
MGLDLSRCQVFILDKTAKDNSLYDSWSSALPTPCVYLDNYDREWVPPASCGVVITAQHYKEPEVGILRRTLEIGIPILVVADGILEYRNTWLNPNIVPGCIFQPVIGHKIACLGCSQARILESWGNLGKCEVTGAPRFDGLLDKKPRSRKEGEPFRVLVMTARTPGFTETQVTVAKRSLQDLKFWFSQNQHLHGIRVEPVWRLTQNLDREIGVDNELTHPSANELAGMLQNVDAIITTPSTTMLEGMLHGLPVALLDYNNFPQYVPAAWTVTAPRHIDQVLPELLDAPSARMLYQDTVLHDALECRSPAAPRMIQLIEEMLRIAHDCRVQNKPIAFPRRILTDTHHGHHLPEERFDMRALYPGHPVFAEMDRTILQVEVEHLKKELKMLRKIIKADNFLRDISKSFPGPRKLLRLWRESRRKL